MKFRIKREDATNFGGPVVEFSVESSHGNSTSIANSLNINYVPEECEVTENKKWSPSNRGKQKCY